MSGPTYYRAKTIIAAAESNPAKFGDLPAKMGDSGKLIVPIDVTNDIR